MVRENEIRIISYALWVRDDKCHGSAIKHWLEAEAIWEQNQKVIKASGKNSIGRDAETDKVATARTR
jgi:hypothetical protein